MSMAQDVVVPPRHKVPLFICLGEMPIGRTRNLSRTGVFIETAMRPDVGSLHELRLAWDKTTYVCVVRVVRHARDGIGVAFSELDSFFAQAVAEILNEPLRTA